ncbi:MAG: hypothetical protein J7K57_03200 [Palaeococcus sp.]|uniref:hypothetical protein n=1 Tax=Palaeococcus sp. (in: euryarchaeotes) TaxID=2820298 RepID=UPI0025D90238|nr:hypothetical protein [Palaeococcus sp. (in: euryarchaeotes)]MCD6558866.1 hypothetical protein [Palaeococcus sp. (in: euryarchaeotes)]
MSPCFISFFVAARIFIAVYKGLIEKRSNWDVFTDTCDMIQIANEFLQELMPHHTQRADIKGLKFSKRNRAGEGGIEAGATQRFPFHAWLISMAKEKSLKSGI